MLLSSKIRDYAARPREFETKEEIQRDLATRGVERPNLQAVPKARLGGRGDKNLIKSKQIWKYWLDHVFLCLNDMFQRQRSETNEEVKGSLYLTPPRDFKSSHPLALTSDHDATSIRDLVLQPSPSLLAAVLSSSRCLHLLILCQAQREETGSDVPET